MNTHIASLINGIILIVIGLWGYLESGSATSLIPVGLGATLLLLNKGVQNSNKVIAHIAVLVTLLSFANIMPLRSALAALRQFGRAGSWGRVGAWVNHRAQEAVRHNENLRGFGSRGFWLERLDLCEEGLRVFE